MHLNSKPCSIHNKSCKNKIFFLIDNWTRTVLWSFDFHGSVVNCQIFSNRIMLTVNSFSYRGKWKKSETIFRGYKSLEVFIVHIYKGNKHAFKGLFRWNHALDLIESDCHVLNYSPYKLLFSLINTVSIPLILSKCLFWKIKIKKTPELSLASKIFSYEKKWNCCSLNGIDFKTKCNKISL